MKKTILSLSVILFSFSTYALVDMRNANYSNSWTDMESVGSGFDMRIVRTYQSRTLFNGMFGFGWCTDFETQLEVNSEGNIKITDCGAGRETIYSMGEVKKAEVDASINKIIAKMKADPKLKGSSDKYFTEQVTQMRFDDQLRNKRARDYGITFQLKEGQKFFANGSEVDHVIFAKNFFTRNIGDGSYQRFDINGRLTHIYDKNGNFVKLEYDKNQLKEVVDNNARRFSFKYYVNRKVKQVVGPNGLMADYKYSPQEDLIWVRDAWAKKTTDFYTYEYNEFHNLTKVTYPNKKFIAIKYDNIKDWVLSFQDADKCLENYSYEFSPNNPKFHYWSTVKKTCGKEVVANNRFEFWHKQRSDGVVYLERMKTETNGLVQDVTYNERFNKPISVRRGNEMINLEYNGDGQVKSKVAGPVRMDFEYDNKFKKVAKVVTSITDTKSKKILKKTSIFRYDEKGNLSYAENSDGQQVSMTYDTKGRIASIVDQSKKVVKLQYDEKLGKPSIVTRPGLGTIKVAYKANGDIANVESPEGAIVATQVASAFNNLLDVIAPATEEISI